MKPSCPVLNAIKQIIRLLTAAITQPVQHLLPTRIVEKTVRTQDKQSSRHNSESTSNFMFYLHSEVGARPISEDVTRNLRNLGCSHVAIALKNPPKRWELNFEVGRRTFGSAPSGNPHKA
jgi:hypothetical protein